jgi:uncharacterized membrane protein
MSLLSLIFHKPNRVGVTKGLLDMLGVKVTITTIEHDLVKHPDYPSLVSVADTLERYGVQNVCFECDAGKLAELPVPFLAQIEVGNITPEESLTVVQAVNGEEVRYYNPERHRLEITSRDKFLKMWRSRLVMLLDAAEASDEKDYQKRRRNEALRRFAILSAWLTLPLLVILSGITAVAHLGTSAILPNLFLLLLMTGSVVSGLLVWYDLDTQNPALQQICQAGKKVNCRAVLNSKGSRIGGIHWSSIGAVYFAGGMLTLLFTGVTNIDALTTLTWFNLLALPFVFFSIYYQWKIARQWCLLCLTVLAVLVLQFCSALSAGWLFNFFTTIPAFHILSTVILSFLLPCIALALLLQTFRSERERNENKIGLHRLKHDLEVFDFLLSRQMELKESTTGLGLSLGNPTPSRKIIEVCNLHCGPCSKAHVRIDELLNNNPDIQIQIIFTTTNSEADKNGPPVKHLMALAEKNNEDMLRQALDDWHLLERKDYDVFSAKYPLNGELTRQDQKIEAMRTWCESTRIAATPTFFVSGPINPGQSQEAKFYKLPGMYTVADLNYTLSV